VHVEAPDEAAHNGNRKDKIQAIEDFDQKIVGPILKGRGIRRISVANFARSFHPLTIKTHSPEPVPFIVFSSEEQNNALKEDRSFDEESAQKTGLLVERGTTLWRNSSGVSVQLKDE